MPPLRWNKKQAPSIHFFVPTQPVVKLEFSKDEFATADSLRDYIYTAISRIAKHHQIELVEGTYTQRFDELVVKLHQKTQKKWYC